MITGGYFPIRKPPKIEKLCCGGEARSREEDRAEDRAEVRPEVTAFFVKVFFMFCQRWEPSSNLSCYILLCLVIL